MPTSHYASCKLLNDGLKIRWGESGLQVTQPFRVNGVTRDDDYIAYNGAITPIAFALSLPTRTGTLTLYDGSTGKREAIPNRGDAGSIVVDINGTTSQSLPMYCFEKMVSPVGKSTDDFIVTCNYGEIGLPLPNGTDSTFMWLVSHQINGGTVPTRTNFIYSGTTETFGKLCQIYYKPGTTNYDFSVDGSLAANLASGAVYSQYANLPGLENITNLQFNCREICHPNHSNANLRSVEAKIAYFNGSMNNAAIWGFPAYTLRCRAVLATLDVYRGLYLVNPDGGVIINGIPLGRTILRDTSYLIEHRKRGWKEIETLKLPQTGFEPPDIDDPATGIIASKNHGNGWGQFAPLVERDFSLLNLPDLRTF